MALFDREKVKTIFQLSKDLEPFVIIALGKIGDYKKAPKYIIDYERGPRPRKTNIFSEL